MALLPSENIENVEWGAGRVHAEEVGSLVLSVSRLHFWKQGAPQGTRVRRFGNSTGCVLTCSH